MTEHSVRVVVTDDLQRRRVTVFFRLFCAIPHLIALSAFTFGAILLAPVAWIIALFRGAVPRELHDFLRLVVRYASHVNAYVCLAAERWPPFAGADTYAIDVELPTEPERQNRWSILFRGLLAFPAFLMVGALGGNAATGAVVIYLVGGGVLPILAFLGWFACLARGRMPQGMRDAQAYAIGYTAEAYAYLLLLTPRYPNADLTQLDAPLPEHPVTLRLGADDLRRHRLLVFFRGLVAVPHFVWTMLWLVAILLVTVVGWVFALFTARLPRFAHRFAAAWVRYQTHLNAFLTSAAQPFPGFVGAEGSYPIAIGLPGEPQRHGRWTVLFRGLLALPAGMISSALQGVMYVAAILGWFAALFTGRMPGGLRSVIGWALRYNAQLMAYGLLLTPAYPYSGPAPCD